MRKVIVTITVIALILSIVSTGLVVFFDQSSPVQNSTVSGE